MRQNQLFRCILDRSVSKATINFAVRFLICFTVALWISVPCVQGDSSDVGHCILRSHGPISSSDLILIEKFAHSGMSVDPSAPNRSCEPSYTQRARALALASSFGLLLDRLLLATQQDSSHRVTIAEAQHRIDEIESAFQISYLEGYSGIPVLSDKRSEPIFVPESHLWFRALRFLEGGGEWPGNGIPPDEKIELVRLRLKQSNLASTYFAAFVNAQNKLWEQLHSSPCDASGDSSASTYVARFGSISVDFPIRGTGPRSKANPSDKGWLEDQGKDRKERIAQAGARLQREHEARERQVLYERTVSGVQSYERISGVIAVATISNGQSGLGGLEKQASELSRAQQLYDDGKVARERGQISETDLDRLKQDAEKQKSIYDASLSSLRIPNESVINSSDPTAFLEALQNNGSSDRIVVAFRSQAKELLSIKNGPSPAIKNQIYHLDAAIKALKASYDAAIHGSVDLAKRFFKMSQSLSGYLKTPSGMVNAATAVIPGISELRAGYELLTGRDMFTGQSLSKGEMMAGAIGLLFGAGVVFKSLSKELAVFENALNRATAGVAKESIESATRGIADSIMEWIGKGSRLIRNDSGDMVLLSKDGTRRVRFDIKNFYPHPRPHGHVEVLQNGRWIKSGPIYPRGGG